MIEIAAAKTLILGHATPNSVVRQSLDQSCGCVLAEDAVSDLDSPPHDKALMDGYAMCAADFASGRREFSVIEEVTAGDVPTRRVDSETATRIMTGAPVPEGADAVVMVEQTETLGGDRERIRVLADVVKAGQNILPKALVFNRGESILPKGRRLSAADIGLLAEIGCAQPAVFEQTKVAILATGNELVDASEVPGPGQIRNSNGPMLHAAMEEAGGRPTVLGVARDEVDDLRRLITAGLQHDVLLLSGGVSAGVLDLVPQVLADQGVEQVFHKVHLKPGKPLWFGVWQSDSRRCLVFGLPGNPVSSFVCFHLFVRPAIAAMNGQSNIDVPVVRAALAAEFRSTGSRPTFFPSRLTNEQGQTVVAPLPWKGSADLRTVAEANALAFFPQEKTTFPSGELVDVYLI